MADTKLIYYDKDSGLIRADKDTIKNSLRQVVIDAYGDDVCLDDNYPDGIVINELAEIIDNSFNMIETNYNMLDINSAEGVILDTLGNIRNEHRREATYNYLYVELTATQDCEFIAGGITLKDESNNYWSSSSIISLVADTPQVAEFMSQNVGYIQEPTTITIASIKNNNTIDPESIQLRITKYIAGENTETDLVFRNRLNRYTVFNSVTIKENLVDKLLDLDTIKDVKIYYNPSTVELQTKDDNVIIDSGHMYILVKPYENIDFITNIEAREEVLETIEAYKGLGALCSLGKDIDISTWTDGYHIVERDSVPTGTGFVSLSEKTSGGIITIIPDGIAEFLVPETTTVGTVTIYYTKTNNFDNTPVVVEEGADPIPASIRNIKTMLSLYVNNKGIGTNLTVAEIINYLNSSTDEIIASFVDIQGASTGKLINKDKILKLPVENITLEESGE